MKTTKKHFDIFKDECKKLQDRFELNNWDIRFVHQLVQGSHASNIPQIDAYNICIYFSTEWSGARPLNEFEIRQIAKHELIHVLCARFGEYGHSRFITKNDMVEAEEELTQKLMNLIV